jgi:hypothetical protein
MTRDAEALYRRATEESDAIRALIPKFLQHKAFIRVTEPIIASIRKEIGTLSQIVASNRDLAVCALVNKACNTHSAIRLLTDNGHGDDAMALGRVLLENAVLLEWLLIDPVYRLDLYCISDALYRRRWLELMLEHFKDKPEFVELAKESVDSDALAVAAFFGNTIHKWAQVLHPGGKLHHVNVEAMMKEITTTGGTPSSFQHDVVYFMHSAYVHSTASSMRSFGRLRAERFFRFDLGPVARARDEALSGANIFLMIVLNSAAKYVGIPSIETDLDYLFTAMKQRRSVAPDSVSPPPATT